MRRYAIYYTPKPGAFAAAAAAWLGYDVQAARAVVQPEIAGLPRPLADLTAAPRKYGFHGTIKAPFRLADGYSAADLAQAVRALAADLAPVVVPGLDLVNLDGFLAFVPLRDGAGASAGASADGRADGSAEAGENADLRDLAAHVVRSLDPYRAPLTMAEIARRRPDQLTPRQRDFLAIYGYPYVLEEFRFHLTLTDSLPEAGRGPVARAAAGHFAGVVPQPFVLPDICLMGEDAQGRFHLLARHALTL